jgi:hypothetical protein
LPSCSSAASQRETIDTMRVGRAPSGDCGRGRSPGRAQCQSR